MDRAAPTPLGGTAGRARGANSAAASGIAAFFDRFAADEQEWRRRNRGYHALVESILKFHVRPGATVLEVGCGSGDLLAALEPRVGVGVDVSPGMVSTARARHPGLEFHVAAGEAYADGGPFDYIVLSDLVPYAEDLLALLKNLARMSHPGTRVIVHSYSEMWRPVIRAAELTRLKHPKPIRNWVTAEDMRNLLAVAGFEIVTRSRRILVPKRIPTFTTFANGVLANVWPFSLLTLTWWIVARPRPVGELDTTVSVVVPCRNEAGTIGEIVARVPELGKETEIVFVEGGSTDDTQDEIRRQIELHPERRMSLHVQEGRGKADAVRLGFARADGDVLMILDGDLSVAPETLPDFYAAITGGAAEVVNGSRLVYGMERGAMQFLNVIGNKFFSLVFSWLIGQPVKDTLCGTKVVRRADYERIASLNDEFGADDPFGDFDILLGAAQATLKIVDLPVRYYARTYGRTNISRFRHGLLLLRMTVVGFSRLKIRPVRVRLRS